MLVSSANKIGIDILFIHLGRSCIYIYIGETIGDLGLNLVGHHVLSVPNYRGCYNDVFLQIETLWYLPLRSDS
jgi:hypothetical protein